jgi:hypothetical protein
MPNTGQRIAMPDELLGVSAIAVEPNHRDLPRRDQQQQGSKKRPLKPPAAASAAESPSNDDLPLVGSRLNVRA